jgi:hypothetical protein
VATAGLQVFLRDVAADTQRVASAAVRVLRADVFEIDDHGPSGIEFAFQHVRGFDETLVIGCAGDDFHGGSLLCLQV